MGSSSSSPQDFSSRPSPVLITPTPSPTTLTELDSLLETSQPSYNSSPPTFRERLPSLSFFCDAAKVEPSLAKQPALATQTGLSGSNPSPNILHLLYISHLTSQWTERSWEFTIVLLLTFISPPANALFLVSSYGLFCELVKLTILPSIGAFVDRAPRLTGFRTILLTQNGAVLACSVACYILVSLKDRLDANLGAPGTLDLLSSPAFALVLVVHFTGALAGLASAGSTVSIEKDWVPQISQLYQDPSAWLTSTNVVMRQIDLSCKVLSPAFAGLVVAWYEDDLRGACLVMGAFNFLTIVVEFVCSKKIYAACRNLDKKEAKKSANSPTGNLSDPDSNAVTDTLRSFRMYFSTPVALPGLALAFLYANVMSYGSVMTAYVAWKGMSPPLIGLTRGISATVGLLGTIWFKWASKYLSLEQAGMISIVEQFVVLGVSFASEFVDDDKWSLSMLIGGVAFSRVGLWGFDMSVSQMQQEQIEESIRGRVGAVQTALCSFFGILSYVQGLYWSRPEEFKCVITASYSGVVAGLLAYAWFFAKSNKM